MFEFYISPKPFGDTIAAAVALENYGFLHGDICYVNPMGVLPKLVDLFNFKYLRIKNTSLTSINVDLAYEQLIKHHRANKDCLPHLISMCYYLCGKIPDVPLVPKYKNQIPEEKDDIVLVQFDNGAARNHDTYRQEELGPPPGTFRTPMTVDEMKKVISVFSESNNIAVIGGPATERYLGCDFEYRIGEVDYISEQLAKCRHFLGCDSGISHLAGLMGIYSKVVVLGHFECVSEFYKSYPNTQIMDINTDITPYL